LFFLAIHRWEKKDELEVSKTLIQLFRSVWYGKIGNPWPKLFFVWLDPKRTVAYALWESSDQKPVEELLAKLKYVKTEIVHIRQIFPPHMDLYTVINNFATNS